MFWGPRSGSAGTGPQERGQERLTSASGLWSLGWAGAGAGVWEGGGRVSWWRAGGSALKGAQAVPGRDSGEF